jgi:hypothetical protein
MSLQHKEYLMKGTIIYHNGYDNTNRIVERKNVELASLM